MCTHLGIAEIRNDDGPVRLFRMGKTTKGDTERCVDREVGTRGKEKEGERQREPEESCDDGKRLRVNSTTRKTTNNEEERKKQN